MDEATHIVKQAQLEARMGRAVMVLARQRAIEATKQALRAKGLKPQHFSMREIGVMAEDYLAQHRQALIAEARPIAERWAAEGFFGTRAAHKALSLCETHAQNGEAK